MRPCPKQMTYGPCGGVTPTLGCEVDGRTCPFALDGGAVFWDAPEVTGDDADGERDPEVWVDFRPDPTIGWEVEEGAAILASAGVGALIGEHVDDPTPHDPATVAEVVGSTGLPIVATLTCRSRSRQAQAAQIGRLVASGARAVHCVTGDHPAARLGLDRPTAFPLDGTELAGLASGLGARVSVAESPAAPPVDIRPRRLRSKQDAGASLAILNHAGPPDALIDFAGRCRAEGVTLDLIAPVPLITDRRSAEALGRFPGLILPPELTETVLRSTDPSATGRSLAVELAIELLESGRFAGVNLSGSGADAGLLARAELFADVARAIGDGGR